MRFWLALLAILVIASPADAVVFIHDAESGGAPSGTWETVWTNPDAVENYDNGDDWNERDAVASGDMTSGGPWTKVRVTQSIGSGTSANATASICIQSSGSDCTATPTQLTLSSSAQFTLGVDTLLDEVTFSFADTDTILCHSYTPDGQSAYFFNAGYNQYTGTGSDDSLVQSPGYSGASYTGTCVLIEGWNPD